MKSVLRAALIFGWLAFGLHVIAILAGVTSPLYTDEVYGHMAVGHVGFDDGFVASVFAQCPKSFIGVPLPWMLQPFALLASIFYGLFYSGAWPPIIVRLLGILNYAVILTLIWKIVRVLYAEAAKLWFFLCVSVLSFGVLPFEMILNRAEQLIAMLTLFIIWKIVETPKAKVQSLRGQSAWVAFLSIAGCYVLYVHPKALYFAPFFFWAVFKFIKKPALRIIPVAVAALVLWGDVKMAESWTCPERPALAQELAKQATTRTDPDKMWEHLSFYFSGTPTVNLFGDVMFATTFGSNWLPDAPRVTHTEENTNIVFGYLAQSLLVLSFLFILRNIYLAIRDRSMPTAQIAGLVLFLNLNLFRAVYFATFFYEATLLAPLWAICLCLCVTGRPFRFNKIAYLPLIFVLIASCASSVALVRRWKDYYLHDWLVGGSLPQQAFSLGTLNYQTWRKEVEMAASACGLKASDRPHRVLVDDTTLYLFQKSNRPIQFTYLYFWDPNLENPLEILKANQSAGAIGSCVSMRKIKGLQLIQTGNYCCAEKF